MKKFNAPEVEIRKFDTADVLTTSATTTVNPLAGSYAEYEGRPCTGTSRDWGPVTDPCAAT